MSLFNLLTLYFHNLNWEIWIFQVSKNINEICYNIFHLFLKSFLGWAQINLINVYHHNSVHIYTKCVISLQLFTHVIYKVNKVASLPSFLRKVNICFLDMFVLLDLVTSPETFLSAVEQLLPQFQLLFHFHLQQEVAWTGEYRKKCSFKFLLNLFVFFKVTVMN